jgi:hypothetical protein
MVVVEIDGFLALRFSMQSDIVDLNAAPLKGFK